MARGYTVGARPVAVRKDLKWPFLNQMSFQIFFCCSVALLLCCSVLLLLLLSSFFFFFFFPFLFPLALASAPALFSPFSLLLLSFPLSLCSCSSSSCYSCSFPLFSPFTLFLFRADSLPLQTTSPRLPDAGLLLRSAVGDCEACCSGVPRPAASTPQSLHCGCYY